METIKVNKAELLAKVQANRAKHKEIVEEALAEFRLQAIAELDNMLADAKAGKRVRRGITLVEPVDQTREYDAAITKLEMCVDDVIEIADHDFRCLVMDQWSWKGQFLLANSAYTDKAR